MSLILRHLNYVRGSELDRSEGIADFAVQPGYVNERMDFHTDMLPVDVLGLFCLRTAKRGGASKLVSALTVHNVLRAERPDLLETLYGTFHMDWRGKAPAGEKPCFTLPMYSEHDGRITTRIVSLPYYRSATRHGEQYSPTAIQLEALEKVQKIANWRELS